MTTTSTKETPPAAAGTETPPAAAGKETPPATPPAAAAGKETPPAETPPATPLAAAGKETPPAETPPAETPPAAAKPKAEDLTFEHLKIIQEEKLTAKDLPTAIKNKMGALKMQVSKYKKNPTDNLKKAVQKQDVVIADLIQTFVEDEAAKKAKAQSDADTAAAATAKAATDADAAAKAKAKADAEEEARRNDPNVKMEAAIRAKLVDNKISTSDLKVILGRSPNTFQAKETIGKLTLKKVWLKEIWVAQ